MDMDYKKVYEEWLTNPFFDEATRQELAAIKDDDKEIKERFYMLLLMIPDIAHRSLQM